MAKPLSKLTAKLKKVNAAASVKAAEMLTEMSLAELRRSRAVTQNDLAESLKMKQPSVAQLEKRDDVYISTLRNYLHALGGELELTARFPDGTKINIHSLKSAG